MEAAIFMILTTAITLPKKILQSSKKTLEEVIKNWENWIWGYELAYQS